MAAITIDEFVESYIKNNEGCNAAEFKELLEEVVQDKSDGIKCSICGQPIWAIGTAVCSWEGCFTCISGEADDSENFKIDTVCWR